MRQLRRGMTLLEILVATSIFVVMSTIMLGVLATGSELYRRGESSRAASDEAMAAISLLDRDIGAALHPNLGGEFWAENLGNGNCIIAFTVHDREASEEGRYAVVAWGAHGNTLRRIRWAEVNPQDLETWPSTQSIRDNINGIPNANANDPLAFPSVVTDGVLAFHAALIGTGSVNNNPANHFSPLWIRTNNEPPGNNPNWQTWGQRAEPRHHVPSSPYRTFAAPRRHYPIGLRLTLLFSGSSRFALTARVQEDNGAGTLRIAGAKGLPTLAGSMCRIGDEIVGYHGISGRGNLTLNSATDGSHGPWNGNGGGTLGRAVLGSAEPPPGGHPRNAIVQFGNPYVLTRVLPGGE